MILFVSVSSWPVDYLYCAFQAALSWLEEISPFSGVGATAALLFVVLVSAVKAGLEDYKRHVEDNITNNTSTKVVTNLETGGHLVCRLMNSS